MRFKVEKDEINGGTFMRRVREWRVDMWEVFDGEKNIARIKNHHGEEGLSQDEAEDNARLIAAAPELLEALEIAEHALVHAGAENMSPVLPMGRALYSVRFAIAKARGQE